MSGEAYVPYPSSKVSSFQVNSPGPSATPMRSPFPLFDIQLSETLTARPFEVCRQVRYRMVVTCRYVIRHPASGGTLKLASEATPHFHH